MLLPSLLRRALADLLALAGAFTLVGALAVLGTLVRGGDIGMPGAAGLMLALTAGSWAAAFRLNRPPRSRAAATGHIVLFEAPMAGARASRPPALTVRGPRDAVERFIPLADFGPLFGGWALWEPAPWPTPDLPGEALGVRGRRRCKRFRRVLRERGATLEVRRERGPEQRLAQLVSARAVAATSSGDEPAA